MANRRSGDWPDSVSGVPRPGAPLSATPHRVVDRPELCFAKRQWRFAVKEQPEERFPGETVDYSTGFGSTTEYPANGSSNPHHSAVLSKPRR